MKLLKCIINSGKLDEVKEALGIIGVQGMTVSEVRGFGRTTMSPQPVEDGGGQTDFMARTEVEIFVPDHLARRALDAVMNSARSGMADDGKIFIMNVDQAVRIRTGEFDDAAL